MPARAKRARQRSAALLALVCAAAPCGATLATAQEDVPVVARRLLEDAHRSREEGRSEEAVERYRKVIDMAPSLLDAYVGLGAVYHQMEAFDTALDVFTEGLERFPDDGTLLFNAAATQLKRDRSELALGLADRAVEAQKDDPAVHALRGTILRRLGRLADAAVELETVVELQDGSARAHFNLGNAYYELGRKEDALAAYARAVELDDSFGPAHYNLGSVLYELERFDEALEAYERALAPVEEDFAKGREISPRHARAYSNLGAIYSKRKSWDRALDAYEKAARLDPSSAAAHYSVGFTHYELGEQREAYAAYQRAVAIDPELPLAYLHLGLVDFENGKLESAVSWLEKGLPRFERGETVQATATLAEAYYALGRVEDAEASYRKTLELVPGDVTARVGLGRVLRERGDVAEARTQLEMASELVLDSSGVAIELAALARAEGDLQRERTLYEEALRREGRRRELWPVHVNLVSVLLKSGALREARARIDELVPWMDAIAAEAPALAERLRTTRGLLLAREGDLEGARAEIEAVLKLDPDSSSARNASAAMAAADGKVDEASRGWRDVAASTPERSLETLARANLGLALWLSGRGEEAREHLLRAAEVFPASPLLRGALGEIALERGDPEGAVRELRAAVGSCRDAGKTEPAASASDFVQWTLRPAGDDDAACARLRQALGRALVSAAGEHLDDSGSRRAVLEMLDEAIGLELKGPGLAQALFARGTLALQQGQLGRARSDLEAAIASGLPDALVASAHNNLGVCLYREGESAEARRHFEVARAADGRAAPATLNLAIACHDARERERALALYDEYLGLGGRRRSDAAQWADGIRKVFR